MRRSRLTSLLGIVSLGLITCSYFLLVTIDSPFAFILIITGIFSSLVFILPAILCAYFETHTPKKGSKIPDEPLGRWFSILYVIFNLGLSILAGALTVEYYQDYPVSPISWVIVEILWISSGMLGILAAIVYRDDKKRTRTPSFLRTDI